MTGTGLVGVQESNDRMLSNKKKRKEEKEKGQQDRQDEQDRPCQ
jgi:hypothetical protein